MHIFGAAHLGLNERLRILEGAVRKWKEIKRGKGGMEINVNIVLMFKILKKENCCCCCYFLKERDVL